MKQANLSMKQISFHKLFVACISLSVVPVSSSVSDLPRKNLDSYGDYFMLARSMQWKLELCRVSSSRYFFASPSLSFHASLLPPPPPMHTRNLSGIPPRCLNLFVLFFRFCYHRFNALFVYCFVILLEPSSRVFTLNVFCRIV